MCHGATVRLEDPSPARLETRVSPIVIRGTSGAGLRARSSFFVPRPACRAFARLRATATTAGRGSRAPASCTRSPRSAHRREQKAGLAHAPPLHRTRGGPRRVRPAAGNRAATTPARAPALATWCSGPAVGMPLLIPVAHQAESSPLLC